MSKTLVEKITEQPRLVSYLYNDLGKTQKEVGELLGCSESVVCNAMKEMDVKTRPSNPRTGEDHPRWGGDTTRKRTSYWRRQREKALERDEYECQECGKTNSEHQKAWDESLHVHHIKPLAKHDSRTKAHRLENLKTLCRHCHIYKR